MTRAFRTLARDERGGSIIELALVLPVLASLLIGMVDISRAYSAKLQLEQAAYRAIEKVQQYQTTTDTYSTLQAEAATAAGVNASAVTVDPWLECNGVRQADYHGVCPNGQVYTRYITVSIQKMFTPMFGSRYFPHANADGTYTLTGQAGLRTQ
jgi:Flp pilus assembly pilin Flp